MPKPAITRVPNLAITPVSTNKNNGLYAPQLTTAQIAAIPAAAVANGGIVYNTTINTFQVYQNRAWITLLAGGYYLVTGNGVDYTVLNSDTIIGVSTANTHTITLPAIATAPIGKIFTIKDVTGAAATRNITIAADANIDGGAAGTQNIAANYGFINVFSNGNQWFISSKLIA